MNYSLHYDRLIERAVTSETDADSYVKKHHIVPRCMGGTDDASNLVKLYADEHFVAHQLLAKMYPKSRGLVFAMHLLTFGGGNSKRNNKSFAWIRKSCAKRLSEMNLGRIHTPEALANMSAGHKGTVFSEEIIAAMRKRIQSEESNAKRSASQKGRIHSDESNAKRSTSLKGGVFSEETLAKMRASKTGIKQSRATVEKREITKKLNRSKKEGIDCK